MEEYDGVKIYGFRKEHKDDKIWWVDYDPNIMGLVLFTFDKEKIYNYWTDYPDNLSEDELKIFNEENPHWKRLFTGDDSI